MSPVSSATSADAAPASRDQAGGGFTDLPKPSPSEANVMRSVNIGGNRYGSLVGTPWGEIVPDAVGAFGVVVAAERAWLSQRASSRSVSVSKTVAAIEQDRRNTERVPRLSARMETGVPDRTGSRSASGSNHPSLWPDQSRSARGPQHGLPGFKRGQNGVANELPSTASGLEDLASTVHRDPVKSKLVGVNLGRQPAAGGCVPEVHAE
jgi:hypothetical protein